MAGNSADFYLRKAQIAVGESGYFSAPDSGLDPHLFIGEQLRGDVRLDIVQKLYAFLGLHWHQPESWARAWLAGSGVSYQWSAARGNGDLDCLIGVDWSKFRQCNHGYEGLVDHELTTMLNDELRDGLWPRTALTRFHGQAYELTYYINENAQDIRNIHPYAAYDLISGTWTVRPPKLPADPSTLYPKAWGQEIGREAQRASDIITRYHKAKDKAAAIPVHTGAWTNAMALTRVAAEQATAMYDDIHHGRREAFTEFGSGYGDWHNFRWQSHKANGIVPALRKIAEEHQAVDEQHQRQLYGRVLTDPEHDLIRAATWRST